MPKKYDKESKTLEIDNVIFTETADGNFEHKCKCCGHERKTRMEEFTKEMALTLQWLYEQSKSVSGNGSIVWFKSVGVTRKKNASVPKEISGNRLYGRLKYWGLVEGGAGSYRWTDKARLVMEDNLRIHRWMWVLDDEPVLGSKGYTTLEESLNRSRRKRITY